MGLPQIEQDQTQEFCLQSIFEAIQQVLAERGPGLRENHYVDLIQDTLRKSFQGTQIHTHTKVCLPLTNSSGHLLESHLEVDLVCSAPHLKPPVLYLFEFKCLQGANKIKEENLHQLRQYMIEYQRVKPESVLKGIVINFPKKLNEFIQGSLLFKADPEPTNNETKVEQAQDTISSLPLHTVWKVVPFTIHPIHCQHSFRFEA